MHIAIFQVLHANHPRAKERLGRRYVLAFEDTRLVALRGGRDRTWSTYPEQFNTPEAVLDNARAKIKRRFSHGYTLIWWTEGFPLLAWMQECAYSIERHEYVPLGIQLTLPLPDD